MTDVFVLIIGVWIFSGISGIIHLLSKEDTMNWEMLIFFAFIPFIPSVAHICGL